MNIDLKGRRALVCGASQGIGEATARMLASMGATVTLVARSEERLKAVRDELNQGQSQKHQYVISDFSKPGDVRKQFADRLAEHPVEILINNSGGPPPGPIAGAEGEDFLDGMRAHLLCNQYLAQAALPGMRQAHYGRIINIISTSVYEPIPGLGVSNTVRAAVAAWAKTLSVELAPEGFTVNNVLPGFTATDRLDSLIKGRAENAGKSEADIAEGMRATVPMARFASAEEVANAIAFLASPAASYITGVSLAVDGGRLKGI
ncbi:MAG: SDR family oxidoreductase [Wenzhouxiangella sp.]